MKVASKIVLVASLTFVPILGVHLWLSLEREESLFRTDMERDLALLAANLRQVAVAEWGLGGAQGVSSVLRAAGESDPRVEVAWRPHAPGETPRPRGLRDERDVLAWVEPVEIGGASVGEIVLSEALTPMHAYLRSTVARLGMLMVFLVAGGLLGARLLSRWLIGRRLDVLVAFAEKTGAGELGGRVDVGGRDEISHLAGSLGTMGEQLAAARRHAEQVNAERLTMLQHLRHADRLASLGRLAGSVAHELGTPLNVVMGHANRIAEGTLSSGQTKESATTIHRQVKRMEATIRGILGFVRQAPGREELVDLNDVVRVVCDLLRPFAKRRQVQIEAEDVLPEARVIGREIQLEQALSNLVSNAIDASPDGGRIEIALAAEERAPRAGGKPRAMLVARVRDEGPGIPEAEMRRLFEAFYTSKPAGHGTGLGLWLADGIVRDHAGWIEVDNGSQGGSCFSIVLPQAGER